MLTRIIVFLILLFPTYAIADFKSPSGNLFSFEFENIEAVSNDGSTIDIEPFVFDMMRDSSFDVRMTSDRSELILQIVDELEFPQYFYCVKLDDLKYACSEGDKDAVIPKDATIQLIVESDRLKGLALILHDDELEASMTLKIVN